MDTASFLKHELCFQSSACPVMGQRAKNFQKSISEIISTHFACMTCEPHLTEISNCTYNLATSTKLCFVAKEIVCLKFNRA